MKLLDEAAVNCLGDNEALGRDARLAGVDACVL